MIGEALATVGFDTAGYVSCLVPEMANCHPRNSVSIQVP